MECTLRTHCPIYHSYAHTLELRGYNLLNWIPTPLRQIELQPTRALTSGMSTYRDNDRPHSNDRDRYTEDREWEDDCRREDDYTREDDYRRDYDYYYRRGINYRRNDNYQYRDDYD